LGDSEEVDGVVPGSAPRMIREGNMNSTIAEIENGESRV
jgi:hypothetical protein